MIKNLTCTECPVGCKLTVETIDGELRVTGNKCPKGEAYAKAETTNPVRILTTIVKTKGMELKMVPVRTDKPVPKAKIIAAMKIIRGLCINHPVKAGDVIVENFLDLGINLIATRTCQSAGKENQ